MSRNARNFSKGVVEKNGIWVKIKTSPSSLAVVKTNNREPSSP
jgi:hypothetical protein